MALYLNILTVILLALVAGLLLLLYFQMRTWRAANREAPLLAEKLTEAMMSSRKGLQDLKNELIARGPELNNLISEGNKLRTELQFLLQRGAQMASQLEAREDRLTDDMPTLKLSPAAQAVVERVAVANGQAATLVSGTSKEAGKAGDPLEELLANLQTPVADAAKKPASKRKRVGPITQAELDLQQSLQRGLV